MHHFLFTSPVRYTSLSTLLFSNSVIRRCSIPIETTSPIPLAQQSTQFTAVTQTTACLPRANTFWKSHPPRVQAPRPRPRPPIVSFSWRLESTRGARPKHQCNLFDCQRVILGCLKIQKKTTEGQKEVNTMGHCPRPHTPPTTYQTLSRVVPMNNPRPTK